MADVIKLTGIEKAIHMAFFVHLLLKKNICWKILSVSLVIKCLRINSCWLFRNMKFCYVQFFCRWGLYTNWISCRRVRLSQRYHFPMNACRLENIPVQGLTLDSKLSPTIPFLWSRLKPGQCLLMGLKLRPMNACVRNQT